MRDNFQFVALCSFIFISSIRSDPIWDRSSFGFPSCFCFSIFTLVFFSTFLSLFFFYLRSLLLLLLFVLSWIGFLLTFCEWPPMKMTQFIQFSTVLICSYGIKCEWIDYHFVFISIPVDAIEPMRPYSIENNIENWFSPFISQRLASVFYLRFTYFRNLYFNDTFIVVDIYIRYIIYSCVCVCRIIE